MDFSLEETMDVAIELVFASQLIFISLYFYVNMHKFF